MIPRKVLGVLAGLMLAATMLTATAGAVSPLSPVACNGHSGVDLFEDVNYGGATIRFCTIDAQHLVRVEYLSAYNWDNRVSSYHFFNTSGRTFRIYADTQYQGVYFLTSTGDSTGNAYVPDVGIYWRNPPFCCGFNDQASSMQIY